MFKKNTKLNIILAGALLAIIVTSCFTILAIIQPSTAVTGEQIMVTMESRTNSTDANPKYGIVAVLVPNDWTIDAMTYTGDYGNGSFSWLHPDSNDSYPSNLDTGQGWIDSIEVRYPSPADMRWEIWEANEAHAPAVDTNYLDIEITMTVGPTVGAWDLGYLLSESSSDFTDPGMWDVSLGNSIVVGVVPVELTSFAAAVSENGVALSWQTATETNNRGFEVERSIDNSTFNVIGFVNGFGTTTEKRNYVYNDKISAAGNYYYRLKQIGFDRSYEYSDVVEVDFSGVTDYAIAQNYPNPFNPATQIEFSLPVDAKVSIKVFSVLGQEVANLTNNQFAAGSHKVNFYARSLTSGAYIYTISAKGLNGTEFMQSRKMLLMK